MDVLPYSTSLTFHKRRASLPIAVLPGKRSTVTQHQVGGLFEELVELPHSGLTLQVKAHLHVDTAMSEVSVEGRLISELIEELAQVAQVRSEFFGGHRGVIPTFPTGRGIG